MESAITMAAAITAAGVSIVGAIGGLVLALKSLESNRSLTIGQDKIHGLVNSQLTTVLDKLETAQKEIAWLREKMATLLAPVARKEVDEKIKREKPPHA